MDAVYAALLIVHQPLKPCDAPGHVTCMVQAPAIRKHAPEVKCLCGSYVFLLCVPCSHHRARDHHVSAAGVGGYAGGRGAGGSRSQCAGEVEDRHTSEGDSRHAPADSTSDCCGGAYVAYGVSLKDSVCQTVLCAPRNLLYCMLTPALTKAPSCCFCTHRWCPSRCCYGHVMALRGLPWRRRRWLGCRCWWSPPT